MDRGRNASMALTPSAFYESNQCVHPQQPPHELSQNLGPQPRVRCWRRTARTIKDSNMIK